MSVSFAPSTDSDVRRQVRALTDYADDPDELPQSKLDDIIEIAKLRLYNEVDSDNFYEDAGLGQALVATTAILAKARVENFSVSSWSIGDQTIDTSTVADSDAVQFKEWNQMHLDGLDASSESGSAVPRNTTEFMGGW